MKIAKKLNSLKLSEMIELMVKGLEDPETHIDMRSFGHWSRSKVCYGCAATNAFCQLYPGASDHLRTFDFNERGRSGFTNTQFVKDNEDYLAIHMFEKIINRVRLGSPRAYEGLAENRLKPDKVSVLIREYCEENNEWLRELKNNYSQEELNEYKEFAEWLKEKGL